MPSAVWGGRWPRVPYSPRPRVQGPVVPSAPRRHRQRGYGHFYAQSSHLGSYGYLRVGTRAGSVRRAVLPISTGMSSPPATLDLRCRRGARPRPPRESEPGLARLPGARSALRPSPALSGRPPADRGRPPAVGKTVLARALAVSLGADLSRVQGHPDLLPSDITGVSVFSAGHRRLEFRPVRCSRMSCWSTSSTVRRPRTQSALLESMEEQQSVSTVIRGRLPRPHMVIATQNPVRNVGRSRWWKASSIVSPLPTAIGYPDAAARSATGLARRRKVRARESDPGLHH